MTVSVVHWIKKRYVPALMTLCPGGLDDDVQPEAEAGHVAML